MTPAEKLEQILKVLDKDRTTLGLTRKQDVVVHINVYLDANADKKVETSR